MPRHPIIALRAPRLVAAAAAAALMALATCGAAQAAAGYRALCAGTYCFHVSNFAKSRDLSGTGRWDVYYYISDGNNRWTHYNVRFRVSGGQTVQFEIPGAGTRSAVRSIAVIPGRVYVVSTQACSRSFLSASQCTSWRTTRFTAPKG